jgi:hypothetical protein
MPNLDQLEVAIAEYNRGLFKSIRACARAHGVHDRTLSYRLAGKPSRREARSEQQLLAPEQEELLVRWLLDAEKVGHAFNHAQLRRIASLVSQASGGSGVIGKNWVVRFLQRHPDIKTKRGVTIDAQRAVGLTPKVITAWFLTLQGAIKDHQITAERMWNMDELGNALGPSHNQTVVGSSSVRPHSTPVVRPTDREWVTTIECANALGEVIPPLIIFKGKETQLQWFDPVQVPEDWQFTTSKNAYTTNDIGLQWLLKVFIPRTTPKDPSQPRLLILDGHGSHVSMEFMSSCIQNNISLIYLIAHASHILQPLDLTVFSPLKRKYRSLVNGYSSDDVPPIKKQAFIDQYRQARTEAMTERNIRSGWAASGIWPLDSSKPLSSPFIVRGCYPLPPSRPLPIPQQYEKTIKTPQTSRQVKQALQRSVRSDGNTRRILFGKVSKTIQRLEFKIGRLDENLQAQKKTVFAYKSKQKKRQPIDPNQLFFDRRTILAAQDKVISRPPKASTTLEATTTSTTPSNALDLLANAAQRVTRNLSTISSLQ